MDGFTARRAPVTCQYCPSTGCRPCVQSYLTQTFQDPHCMECKRGWSSEFMAANFPLSFRNDTLRKWRRRILVEREKATLPAMQEFVEHKRAMQRASNERGRIHPVWKEAYDTFAVATNERARLQNRLATARDTIRRFNDEMEEDGQPFDVEAYLAAKERKKKVAKELEEYSTNVFGPAYTAYTQVNEQYSALREEEWRAQAAYEGRAGARRGEAKREFIMKCPDGDCRGFLSSAYKCGTCEKWTCAHCLDVLGPNKDVAHTCNKDAVETAKTIKSETRPCPKCGARIFKIDGCDQMYCTVEGCGTAFSWETGRIETGRVHNPHYYEWLRRTGGGQAPREAGDIPCGGMPNYYHLLQLLNAQPGILDELHRNITESHRNLEELIHYRLRDFQVPTGPLINKEIDVLYLMKDLDEAEWCRQLEFKEARARRKTEVLQILQMAVAAGSDLFRQMVQELPLMPYAVRTSWLNNTVWPQLEQLRAFVNHSFEELAKRQHMAVPQFGACWKWVPLRALYKGGAEEGDVKKRGKKATAAAAGGGGEVADTAVAAAATAEEPDEWAFLAEDAAAPAPST